MVGFIVPAVYDACLHFIQRRRECTVHIMHDFHIARLRFADHQLTLICQLKPKITARTVSVNDCRFLHVLNLCVYVCSS